MHDFKCVKSFWSGFEHDIHGYIGYMPSMKHIFVVYRGSQSATNWSLNTDPRMTQLTDIIKMPGSQAMSRTGWHDASVLCYEQVLPEVSKLVGKFKDYKLVVTGHSLGGIMAQLTAMYMHLDKIPCNMVNFGVPSVGNQAYCDISIAAMPNQLRFVFHKDAVPHMKDKDGSLRQCPTEIYIEKDFTIQRGSNLVGEEAHLSTKWKTEDPKGLNYADHMIEGVYLDFKNQLTKC